MDAMRKHLVEGTIGDVSLRSSLDDDRKKLGVDLTEYQALRAEYDVWEKERKAQIKRDHDEYELRQEAAKAALENAKSEWIIAHGSAYLKRACIEHGYDCQRMYAIERAAIEAPGYTLDYQDAAEWKARACPSEKALDLLEAAQKLGVGDAQIVWLTREPRSQKREDYEDYEEFEACEAVVIRNYLGKYDLVKII